MGVMDKLRLRWFLIGFFNSAEGWNWECPFSENDNNTLKDDFEAFLKRLESGCEDTVRLLRYFKECLEEEREQSEALKELTDKIAEKTGKLD